MSVCVVVTPANPGDGAIKLFSDCLTGLRRDQPKIYKLNKAQEAVTYANNNKPAVLVADGTKVTTILQNLTSPAPTVPIVQALGGGVPTGTPMGITITGFTIDAEGYCKWQFKWLHDNGYFPVAVLWDSMNDFGIYQRLYDYVDQNYTLNDVFFPFDAAGNKNNITSANIAGPADKPNKGFMLIPGALFYNDPKKVTDAVDGAQDIQAAIYPEREYKNAHGNKAKAKKVHGHHVLATFVQAALYVDTLLDDPTKIMNPPFMEVFRDDWP